MEPQSWNTPSPANMIDTPVPSPTRSAKLKPLRKLNLKKDEQHPVSPDLAMLLARNNLGTYPENRSSGLFEALSTALFLKKELGRVLRTACTSFMKQCIQRQLFPANIKGLANDSLIFSKYLLDPDLYIFDPITLELVSNMLELSITVYSGFRGNRVLFGNTVNSGFIRKVELVSSSNDGQIWYAAVFSKENLSLIEQISPQQGSDSARDSKDEDSWGYGLSPLEEAQLNEQILQVCLKKLGIHMSTETSESSPNGPLGANLSFMNSESSEANTQGTEILTLGLSSEIQRCLLTTPIMEKEINKLAENEDNLNSAQKQLSEIYHVYTKTVQVEHVTEKRKMSNHQGLLSSAKNTPNPSKPQNSEGKATSGFGFFDFGSGKAPAQAQMPTASVVAEEAEKSQGSNNEEQSTKQKTYSESVGDGTLIDEPAQLEISLQTNSFPNRVDESLPPDFFIGRNPPGLSRPVMYINNTRVKKLLNENVLKTPKSVSKKTFDYEGVGTPTHHYSSGTKHKGSRDESDNDLGTTSHVYSNPNFAAVAESQHFLLDKIKEYKSLANPERKKPVVVLKEDISEHRGRLKFYNEKERYGFVTLEDTGQDVFVYEGELIKCELGPDSFKTIVHGKKLPVIFNIVDYIGKKGKKCRKAVDIRVVPEFSSS